MATCFIIQPFGTNKFDKLFEDVYEPALDDAGLNAYRVDKDPAVLVPIDAIEEGIANAALCLADISTNNPNVWYELGFAFAIGCPVIMVCSNERAGKYPFDIQHRTVISYAPESPSDFTELRKNIAETASAYLSKAAAVTQVAQSNHVASQQGLSQQELLVLAIVAGDTAIPDTFTHPNSLKAEAERAGLTSVAFGLAFRTLIHKSLIEVQEAFDEYDNERFNGIQLTTAGWKWVEENKNLFSLKKSNVKEENFLDEDIPF